MCSYVGRKFVIKILYCIVLYCIVLYCIVLYCIVLYCIVLYCIAYNLETDFIRMASASNIEVCTKLTTGCQFRLLIKEQSDQGALFDIPFSCFGRITVW